MQSNRCPSCGTNGAPSDQFCENCGARLAPTIAPYPYYPSFGPPPKDHTALIVVIVIVAVVVLVVLPAILYVMVSGLITGVNPGQPQTLGVVISKSADGSNWILAFTSVTIALSQNGTRLTLISSSGSTLLPPTTLYSLEGTGMNGVSYLPAVMGPSMTFCAPGDRITISVSLYPAGTQAQISNAGNILFAGTLQ